MRTGIPLKITSAYLYCYLFLQSLNNISINCANIKYSMAINKSYFKEEYSNISICSLKYKFKKEEKSDPDTGHFFPGSVQLAWNLLAWFTNLKIWVLKTWKPRWFYWLAQTSFYDCIYQNGLLRAWLTLIWVCPFQMCLKWLNQREK